MPSLNVLSKVVFAFLRQVKVVIGYEVLTVLEALELD